MTSRSEKYNNLNNDYIGSRTKKNEYLYNDTNFEAFDVNLSSNALVIGDNDKNIDIDKVKKILESKYIEEPRKNNSLSMVERLEDVTPDIEDTKEYDINAILEKAHATKEVDYERDRLKKIRDTQYDILKSLEINQEKKEQEKDLINLINTINEKEETKKLDPLDLLSDLKGGENTVVLDGIKEEIDKKLKEEVKNSANTVVLNGIKEEIDEKLKEEVKREVDTTLFTNSLSFTQSDFDDFNDLKEDVESSKVIIKILLVVVVVVLIVGVIMVLNSIFHFA